LPAGHGTIRREERLKVVMRAKTRQILCIGLLPFLLAASVASLDALVLCTADGNSTAVDMAHPARTGCDAVDSRGCRHPGGPPEKIGHDHVTCNDVPLRFNQGNVQDRRPVVSPQAESLMMDDMGLPSSESSVCLPGHCSSLDHLRSVVLLI